MMSKNEKDEFYVKVFEDVCGDCVYNLADRLWNRISLEGEIKICSEALKGYLAWIKQGFETNTLAQTQAETVKVDRIEAILQGRKEEESSDYIFVEVAVRRGKNSHSRVRYSESEETANRVYEELKRHLNSCDLE